MKLSSTEAGEEEPKGADNPLSSDYDSKKASEDFEKDKDNFLKAVNLFWDSSPEERQSMADKARTALDPFRPEVIKEAWKKLLIETKPRSVQQLDPAHKIDITGERNYGS